MKTVAVVGANGKMGSLVCKKLENEFNVAKVDVDNSLNDFSNLDLVVDFANGSSSANSAIYCEKNGVPLIVGATGQTDQELSFIEKASKAVPVLKAGNFSVGILLLKRLLTEVLKVGGQDVVIFEKHHRGKVDSPSGTALEIAKVVESQTNKAPQILAERGGKEIGTHAANIYFGDEVISLKHQAFSREVFADGAVLAVKFLLNQTSPKLYDFDDVFKK